MKALADIVKRGRLARGMRGIDLAQAIGKDPSYITKLEHGTLKEIPDPATLAALAAAIHVSQVRLLEAIGYQVREASPPAALAVDSDRAALIETIVRDLTEADARVLAVTARAIVEERDARTVGDAAVYAVSGRMPPTPTQPVPSS